MNGNVETVEWFLHNGMSVDAVVGDWTAFHFATFHNRIDIVKQLLDGGADVNRQTRNKNTPLHYAARNNNSEVARLLINNGADVSIVNDRNKTSLDVAHEGSEVERLLLQLQQSAP